MASKAKEETITSYVITKAKDKNMKKSLLEVDDMINHHLELLDSNKEILMRQAISDINKSVNKKKIVRTNSKEQREYFNSLNDYFMGKLFYIALKESYKYLKIAEIEMIIDRKTLMDFVGEIEAGQEYAWGLIENLKNDKLKNFLYGIFTYLYF